jgi:hypothetical protein
VDKIELESNEEMWFLRWGNLWMDHLTADEALGTIASIIYAGKAGYLKTDEEHAAWNAKYQTNSVTTDNE